MKIFLVEDDPTFAKLIAHHLELNPDHQVRHFSRGKALLAELYQKPDLILLDYSLPDMSGKEILDLLRSSNAQIPIVIVSGQEDIGTAIDLLKRGAYDYIVKDRNVKDHIWKTINNIQENTQLRQELEELQKEVGSKYDFSNIKGTSAAIKGVFRLIEKAARTNITVSINGETGTGKELVAKAIHYNSAYAKKQMVSVNVAAIPSELLESELFGHEKGAFTGADVRRVGKFEQAKDSTLFLDEIGDMDLSLQAKLLRVLQEKEFSRVGGNELIKFKGRIIVATHCNLQEMVQEGKFREDLYYRLFGLPIELPPLRERDNDTLLLAKHFLKECIKENNLGKLSFSKEAQDLLMQHTWPGNVRELRAVVELAAVLCDGQEIQVSDINLNNQGQELEAIAKEGLTLKEYNRRLIQYYLEKYDHNVLKVAKQLDVGKSTLYRMLKNKELSLN